MVSSVVALLLALSIFTGKLQSHKPVKRIFVFCDGRVADAAVRPSDDAHPPLPLPPVQQPRLAPLALLRPASPWYSAHQTARVNS